MVRPLCHKGRSVPQRSDRDGQLGVQPLPRLPINEFARVTAESTTHGVLRTTANGNALGAQFVQVSLNGLNLGRAEFAGSLDNTGAWTLPVSLRPGSYALKAQATHPSGQFTTEAANSFTVSAQPRTISQTYDGEGNLTQRVLYRRTNE